MQILRGGWEDIRDMGTMDKIGLTLRYRWCVISLKLNHNEILNWMVSKTPHRKYSEFKIIATTKIFTSSGAEVIKLSN